MEPELPAYPLKLSATRPVLPAVAAGTVNVTCNRAVRPGPTVMAGSRMVSMCARLAVLFHFVLLVVNVAGVPERLRTTMVRVFE